MTLTKVPFGQILIVFATVLAGLWIGTEWAALHLGFQPRPGAPWFVVRHFPVYYPWRWRLSYSITR
jgi:type IV secretion system protein VirD4